MTISIESNTSPLVSPRHDAPVVASRMRRVLVVLLDAFVFYSLVGAATLRQPLRPEAVSTLGTLWLVLEIGLYRSGYSPGFSLLSMKRRSLGTSDAAPLPLVDPMIAQSETKLTLLTGFFFVFEGWSTLRNFGPAPSDGWLVLSLIMGVASIVAGYLVFHLKRLGFGLGLIVLGATLVLLLAGWDANVRALQLADPNHSSAGAIVLVALSVLWTILRGAGMMLIRNRLTR